MTPTFRPVVYAHHKRKDGTFNVKINVYFNGKERRLPTTINCTKNDLTRSFHIKSAEIIAKCNEEIIKMQKAVSEISFFELEGKDVDWLVARIKAKLTAASFSLDFFEFADKFVSTKKESTAITYHSALNALAMFRGSRQLDINSITRLMLVEFMEWWDMQPKMVWNKKKQTFIPIESKRKPMQSSTIHVNKLAVIFNEAKKRYNDEDSEMILIPRSPFDNLPRVKITCEGQSPLSHEVMQKIILAEVPARRVAHRKALDIAVVSFCLMGANLADLIEAEVPQGDVFRYYRKKTRDRRHDRAEMRVNIPEQAKPYLRRLGHGKSSVWLPELLSMSAHEKRLTHRVNASLKAWCISEGIEPFTFYAIRKTWATLARKVADKGIVDECLAHVGDFSLTDIYAERPWDRINQANDDVLAMFEWPE